MVSHKLLQFDKRLLQQSLGNITQQLQAGLEGKLLRWSVNKVEGDTLQIEASILDTEGSHPNGQETPLATGKKVVVSLIPTGIGCSIGGFAADAAPATSLMASLVDYLITNPNAVNASNFINIAPNVLYSEGLMIDRFMKGSGPLYASTQNKVGLVVEHTSKENLDVVYNIANAVRAVYGVDIAEISVTEEPLGSYCQRTRQGAYVGDIERPDLLFKACDALIDKGCNAIAVTSNISGVSMENYALHFRGGHPNPVGGVEAIISHSIVDRYQLPSSHAPMINEKDMGLGSTVVDARGAGEWASKSGLACVLIGLAKAPQLKVVPGKVKDIVGLHDVIAVVAPASAMGSVPVFSALRNGIPVIGVRENTTILQVSGASLGLPQIIEAENYFEAAGIIQGIKEGISLDTVRRPLPTLQFEKTVHHEQLSQQAQ